MNAYEKFKKLGYKRKQNNKDWKTRTKLFVKFR